MLGDLTEVVPLTEQLAGDPAQIKDEEVKMRLANLDLQQAAVLLAAAAREAGQWAGLTLVATYARLSGVPLEVRQHPAAWMILQLGESR